MTAVLRDLARLKLPVTAAAALATVLALVQPFGITLAGDDGAAVTGALVAVGVISSYLSDRFGQPVDPDNPVCHPEGMVFAPQLQDLHDRSEA